MHQTAVRLIRQAVTAPALIGVIACSGFVADAATAESASPAWLVTTSSTPTQPVRSAQPVQPVRIVRGLTVHPEADPRVLPLQGYRLTATFGSSGGLWSSDHTGLDFAAPEGTPLAAIGPGTVTEVGYDGSYGNKTVVRLEDGTELWYCHQSSQQVSVGEQVAAGDVIGAVGSTGNSTGPHLHLEVRVNGEPVDPAGALANWGIAP